MNKLNCVSGRLDFRRSLARSSPVFGPVRGKGAGSFPERRLVIEPTFLAEKKHIFHKENTQSKTACVYCSTGIEM